MLSIPQENSTLKQSCSLNWDSYPKNTIMQSFFEKAVSLSTISLYDPQTKILYIADSLEDEQEEAILSSLVPNLAVAFQDQPLRCQL